MSIKNIWQCFIKKNTYNEKCRLNELPTDPEKQSSGANVTAQLNSPAYCICRVSTDYCCV